VKDINPGPNGSYPFEFGAFGESKALFAAYDGVHGNELWITDGTPGGTQPVKDINQA
jgi:ELWxxDGT repeat protein